MRTRIAQETEGKGKGTGDAHSRLIYLLVAFGLVTVCVVIGCFGCSNEPLQLGEVNALIQVQRLGGTTWGADISQGMQGLDGWTIERLEFSMTPSENLDLDVELFEDGNPMGMAGVLHGNAQGLSLRVESKDIYFDARYSVSTDGNTETFVLVDSQGIKAYFQKQART